MANDTDFFMPNDRAFAARYLPYHNSALRTIDPVRVMDGRIYEKRALQDWFALHESSPMTGLPMDTDFEEERVLAKRIEQWSQGLDIGEVEERDGPPPKRQRLNDSSISFPAWTITFSHDLDNWSITISPSESLSRLYDLAFRRLNMKAPTNRAQIRLLYDAKLLPNDRAYAPIRMWLRPDALLMVELPAVAPSPGRYFPDFRSGCLIKVYLWHTPERPEFSYWEPLSTSSRVMSVLLRYVHWLQVELGELFQSASDLMLHTLVPGLEDCIARFRAPHLWRPLKDLILQDSTPGWLGNDPWIIRPSDRQSMPSVPSLSDCRFWGESVAGVKSSDQRLYPGDRRASSSSSLQALIP